MSVIAQFTVPADQFLLGEIFEVGGGPEIRLESVIPTGNSIVPYFWVASDHVDTVQTTLDQSAFVDEVTVVDESSAEVLFRVAWSENVNGLFELIRTTDAALLEAEGLGDDWVFRLRFPARDTLSEFYQTCIEQGLSLELEEVNSPFSSSGPSEFSVSDPQREVLLTALELGYFDIPRGINLTDLSAKLDISDTAASQRIRRGMKTLLTETLARRESRETPHTDET